MKTIGNILLYILAFVIIVAAVFCGIQLYKEVKAESYVNGSIDISNKFSAESFTYSASSVVFYHDLYDDSDTYTFEKELLKVETFDGSKNKYSVTLNKFVLLNTEVTSGSVFANLNLDFYDTNGNVVNSALLKISVKFLSNKTVLTLATTGKENASFLEQYFADNGIRLKIIEIIQGV